MDTPQTRRSFYHSFRISSQIQYRYTQDTAVILLLIQASTIRYRLDMLQTRQPFYLSFKFNYQLQVQIRSRHGCHSGPYTRSLILPSAVDTEFILLFIQISTSDTVQIRSRHGCHSVTHSEFILNTQLLHIQMFLYYPLRIQIHSRHGSHSDIHL